MADEQTKQRSGCRFYGCIVILVLLGFILAGTLLALHKVKGMINYYTEAKPITLPTVQMAPADLDKLQLRVEQFRDAVRQGDSVPPPLTLNSTEINALIATDPDMSALKRKLFVTLTNNQVKGLLSIPMEQLGLPVFKGRYLNGEGLFTISFRNGQLYINATKLRVKGKEVPETYMNRIRQQNLAENLNQDPRGKAALSRLKDIQVRDDQLMIVPKGSKP